MFVNGLEIGSDGRVVTSSVAVAAGDPAGGGFTYDRTTGGIKAAVAVPTSYANGFGFNAGQLCVGAGPTVRFSNGLPFNALGQLVTDGAGAIVGSRGGWPLSAGGLAIQSLGPPPFTANQLVGDYRFEEPTGNAQNSSVSPSKMPELAVMSGGCATSTVQFYEGARSVKYTGAFDNNNMLGCAVGANCSFGLADFEVSFQAFFGAILGQWGQGLISFTNGTSLLSPALYLAQTTGQLIYQNSWAGTPTITVNTGLAPTLNTWKELKIKRVSGVTTIYYGGTAVGTTPDTTNYAANVFMFGSFYNQAGGVVNAYFDLLRIYNGAVAP